MSGRILMTTVAALALAIPAMAQDAAAPTDTEQQMEQGAQPETAPEGATEQAPAMTEEQPAASEEDPAMAEEPPATEQDPAMAEEPPATEQDPAMAEEPPATEQDPAMAEEPPATEQDPAMAEEPPATEQDPAMAEEAPTDQPADQQTAEQEPPANMEFLQVQEEQQFLANDEVIGADVMNDQDAKVGTIADLVMDQDQKLVGIVISVGGFLGIGDKWVAVPVEQIDFPTAEQPARLLAAVTEEQLTNAPDFMTREDVEAEQAASDATMQQQTPAPTAAPAQ